MMLVLKKINCLSNARPWQCHTAYKITTQWIINASLHHNLIRSISLGFSTIATTATKDQSAQTPFIVDYLIQSCGFSPPEATKASKTLSHLKSTSKPEKVVHFLKQSGFTDAHIKKCIIRRPTLLCANVEGTLEPKLKALEELGFSQREMIQLASESPSVFEVRNIRPQMEFWRAVLGNNENILKASRRTVFLFHSTIDSKIMPNILLLRECGVSDDQLTQLIVTTPRLVTRTPDALKPLLSRVDALGIPRGSGMYCCAVRSLYRIGEAGIDKKFKLLMMLGFSKTETEGAVRKFPPLLTVSESKMCSLMNFFLNDVGCKASYVAQHPVLLSLSLEKRLFPRHHVLQMLKSQGLHSPCLLTAVTQNERRFLEKYVFPNQEKVPRLHEAYVAACQGKVPG